ncbi:HlyD family secretion protein [Sphingobium sp. AN558]|uniref:HlyD family secretion protein n=1 Tax=Sphingobium sp. AN558 TaxID=3133442 RepID=UPI0030C54EA2
MAPSPFNKVECEAPNRSRASGQALPFWASAPKDVGFVRAGQEVAVKIAAFPFTRFGVVSGRVESISSDAVEDEKRALVYPRE